MHSLLALIFAAVTATAAPMPSPQTLPKIVVAAPRATLALQVANTEQERETGLMGVTHLRAHTGMLFIFAQDAPVEFWMKNTLVPLDMVFLSANGTVRSVASNVPVVAATTPDSAIPRRGGTAKYVIELPAGEAERDAIIPGVHLPVESQTSLQ